MNTSTSSSSAQCGAPETTTSKLAILDTKANWIKNMVVDIYEKLYGQGSAVAGFNGAKVDSAKVYSVEDFISDIAASLSEISSNLESILSRL